MRSPWRKRRESGLADIDSGASPQVESDLEKKSEPKPLEQARPSLPERMDGRRLIIYPGSSRLPRVELELRSMSTVKAHTKPAAQRSVQKDEDDESQIIAELIKDGLLPPDDPVKEGPPAQDQPAKGSIPPGTGAEREPKSIALPAGSRGTVMGIAKGNIIVLEARDSALTRALAHELACAFLDRGRTVSYVSTAESLPAFIRSMQLSGRGVVEPILSERLVCTPVYPLIQGQPVKKSELLEKLVSSPTLYGKDVLVIDSLSEFVEEGSDAMKSLDIWPFLRKVTMMDRFVLVTIREGHKEMDSLRAESNVYMQIDQADKGSAIVKVLRAPEDRPDSNNLLRFTVSEQEGLTIEN